MTADFAQLYSELGIRTDCTLEEFKQVCRRRIRQQHPDRVDAIAADNAGGIPLAELLPLYAKALRFHRKHGRLPGAAPPPAAMPMATHPAPSVEPPGPSPTAAAADEAGMDADPSRPSLRGPLLAMLAIAGFLAVLSWWKDDPPSRSRTAAPPVPAARAVASGDQAVVEKLEIGMDAESVRRIQGDPLQLSGSQWVYGPSWLYFEDDQLVDWYSSPLYPLKAETSSPPLEETERE